MNPINNAWAQRAVDHSTVDNQNTITVLPLFNSGIVGGQSAGGSNGGSGDDDPSVLGRVYIILACMRTNDISPDCQGSVAKATETLTSAMAEENASNISKRELSVYFPNVLDRAEQIKFLFDIENAAISAVQLKLNLQLKEAAPFHIQQLSPAAAQLAIAEHVKALNLMNEQARQQANGGRNWYQNTPPRTYTFRFRSNAYNQAIQINRSGWGSN